MMDSRVQHFIETVAVTLAGLEVALFFQDNPDTFDSSSGIALRTRRPLREVDPALQRLADHNILERHVRGDGRYSCFALSKSSIVWNLLCLVSETYMDNPCSRKEIIRLLMSSEHRHDIPDDEHPRPYKAHDQGQ